MSLPEDRPLLDERYAAAIQSHHLELLQKLCDLDHIIAAGWCKDGLGAKLFRLRTEFDSVRSSHHMAQDQARAAVRDAARLSAAARNTHTAAKNERNQRRADELLQSARDMAAASYATTEEAERAAMLARALIMVQLKSAYETRTAVHSFAIGLAVRMRFVQPGDTVHDIGAGALDLWVDPCCRLCGTRGFNGGFLSPKVLCVDCGGTGKRGRGPKGYRFHATEAGQRFGQALLAEMERKADEVTGAMRRFLAQRETAKTEAPEATESARQLKSKLVDLRSTQAEMD